MKNQMVVGTVIRTKHNTHGYPERDGYQWNYIYYEFRDGDFIINKEHGGEYKFNGQHFYCLGSDYWVDMKGSINGMELLDEPFEIVTVIPELKP